MSGLLDQRGLIGARTPRPSERHGIVQDTASEGLRGLREEDALARKGSLDNRVRPRIGLLDGVLSGEGGNSRARLTRSVERPLHEIPSTERTCRVMNDDKVALGRNGIEANGH